MAFADKLGARTWDWVPGWGCYVTAYYTRSASTAYKICERE